MFLPYFVDSQPTNEKVIFVFMKQSTADLSLFQWWRNNEAHARTYCLYETASELIVHLYLSP